MSPPVLSVPAGRIGASPHPRRKADQIATLNDVLDLFASPPGEPDRQRAVRYGAGGLALHWLAVLPDGEHKRQAIERLGQAAELACEALYPAGACS